MESGGRRLVASCLARSSAAASSCPRSLLLSRRSLTTSTAAAATTSSLSPHKKPVVDLAEGSVDQIGVKYGKIIGPRTLVVCPPPRPDRSEDLHTQRVITRLRGAGIDCATYSMFQRYPTTEAIDEGAAIAKRMGAQSIVGIGGGSAVDLAKGVAALAGTNGKCREFLRVYHKEKKLTTKPLPIVAISTSSSLGCFLSPQTLVLYEPEEALVPIHAEDLSPEVIVIDPSLYLTLAPQARVTMALSALAVCFDALACGSIRGVLDQEGMSHKILKGTNALAQGLRLSDRGKLAEGSLISGQLLRLCRAPPIQSMARCLAPLFPLASYAQLTTILFRSYLVVLADRLQTGTEIVNDALLAQVADSICGGAVKSPGLLEIAEFIWAHSQQSALGSLAEYRLAGDGKEEKTAEALATQVSSVLELFHVDGGEALQREIIRDVIEVSLGI